MLSRFLKGLKKIGDFVSGCILVVFYFTLFTVFSICVKPLSDFLGKRPKKSNFVEMRSHSDDLESFRYEG